MLAAPAGAWTHSPIPGIGSFYDGMLHPVVVPAQLLALMAGGLLIGALAGSWLGAAVIISALSLLVDLAQRPWMKVGVRIVASWIDAATPLVLALQLAGPRPATAPAAPAATASGTPVATR